MRRDFELKSYHFRFLFKFTTLQDNFKENAYLKPLPPLAWSVLSPPNMRILLSFTQAKLALIYID